MDKTGQGAIANHLNQWKESGLSKKEYCEQAGINYWAFKRWCYSYGYVKKRSPRSENGFIQLKPTSAPTTGKMEVIYPNGVRIQLSCTGDKDLLQTLVNL
jgi:hypothetical protein